MRSLVLVVCIFLPFALGLYGAIHHSLGKGLSAPAVVSIHTTKDADPLLGGSSVESFSYHSFRLDS